MILKESFRMQNHLSELSQQAMFFLSKPDNVLKVKEEHLKKRSYSGAEDETKEVKRNTDMTADNVIGLYLDILSEREKLAGAIGKAKTEAGFDIDAAICMNKARQEAISRFRPLAALKSSETDEEGTDYLINTDGNQTEYHYTIRSVKTIDFDRDALKGIIKRLQRESDEVSAKTDLINVTLEVDYTPVYDTADTFEDAYEKFINKQKAYLFSTATRAKLSVA